MEEVTKIQLSYRIIKSDYVDNNEEKISVINTKVDSCIKESFPSETSKDLGYEHIIDLDIIREEIRKELLIESEQERYNIIELGKKEVLAAKQKGFEQGIKEGFDQGYKKGLKEAEFEAIKIKDNAISIIDQAHKQVKDYLLENQHNIIKLAANMAESIVHTTIDESSKNIIQLVKPILQQYSKMHNIIITCHSESIDYIKCYLHELEESCPNAKITVLTDNNLEKNGCVIENENSIIDLQIREQLNSMIQELIETKTLE